MTGRSRLILCTALLATLPSAPVTATEIYQWVDDDGVTHFSQWAPAGNDADVTPRKVEGSTPDGYQPAEDPYSVLNQYARIHERWSALRERDDEPSEDEARRPAPAARDYERAVRYPVRHALLFRPRVGERRRQRQQAVLEEFERRARPQPASINSSVHRARIEAKRDAIATVRQAQRGK